VRPVPEPHAPPRLCEIAREWTRIGCVGFGGPPAHIQLLRDLCVERRRWLAAEEFEDAIAAANLLPGPASTQLAIFCAWRLRGAAGALIGGLGFIVPGLVAIVALAAAFLAGSPPEWLRAVGAGAGAAVPAVAVHAGAGLLPASWRRGAGHRVRWVVYLLLGCAVAATIGPWVVLVLLGCGLAEVAAQRLAGGARAALVPLGVGSLAGGGTAGALAWVAFKVGALSYGGGFVIVPLMQHDAVDRHHWMTSTQFLYAVALGQVTPGPVTHTVTAVGYAAAGVAGSVLAAVVAFAPSFAFVLAGGPHFDRLRRAPFAQKFFEGAGPAAVGAILGSAIPLAAALGEPWQFAVLAAAAVALLLARAGVVVTIVGAGVVGAIVGLAGAPLPS